MHTAAAITNKFTEMGIHGLGNTRKLPPLQDKPSTTSVMALFLIELGQVELVVLS